MKKRPIIAHLEAIRACNQRGGRMLSLLDLLMAESLDLPLAAYLAAMMRHGSSLLVGAQPGGAGKTTVMCALLNFVPNHVTLQATESRSVLQQAQHRSTHTNKHVCYVAHEISPATYYYAYLWGETARRFFKLPSGGYIIASNLHADTLEETRDQLVGENGVAPEHLDAVTLKVYLGTRRRSAWSMQRWIRHVYENDGDNDRLIWKAETPGHYVRQDESHVISEASERHYVRLLTEMQEKGIVQIGDVRRVLLNDTHQAGSEKKVQPPAKHE